MEIAMKEILSKDHVQDTEYLKEKQDTSIKDTLKTIKSMEKGKSMTLKLSKVSKVFSI